MVTTRAPALVANHEEPAPSNRVVTRRMPAFTEGRRRAEYDAIRAAEATK